jgi:hypothetical protein
MELPSYESAPVIGHDPHGQPHAKARHAAPMELMMHDTVAQ